MTKRTELLAVLAASLWLGGCNETSRPASTEPSPQAQLPAATPSASQECARQVSIPITPAASHAMKWNGGTARGEGNDPHSLFIFPPISRMCGIRLRFTLETRDAKPAVFQLYWASAGRNISETEGSWSTTLESRAEEQTIVVRGCAVPSPLCADRNIDRLRIDPATAPVTFRLAEITVFAE